MKTIAHLFILLTTFALCGFAQEGGRELPKEDHLRWWRESRFGMFIHWGPVSIKGTGIS